MIHPWTGSTHTCFQKASCKEGSKFNETLMQKLDDIDVHDCMFLYSG